jgi:hypothetical protein
MSTKEAPGLLDEVNPGRWLRQKREQLTGKWQGPLGVPRGSIVICMALGSPADELATELLVRLVCGEKIDARHFSSGDIDGTHELRGVRGDDPGRWLPQRVA